MDSKRHAQITCKLDISGIDWDAGEAAGLSEGEKFILTYFADIEAQTIMYMRDLLHTSAVHDPDVIAFLSFWNYEEYFHGEALGKLLDLCKGEREPNRIAKLKQNASLREKFEAWAIKFLSKVLDGPFVTMYMTWGAIQELTTHSGYERIRATTQNPVLAELCKRINKQERVHFSWYYNNAKRRLEENPKHQKFVRFMVDKFWSPVGSGVKTDAEVTRLFVELFGEGTEKDLFVTVDSKVSELPGLEGLTIMENWFGKHISHRIDSVTA